MVTFTATDDGDPAASSDTTITIFVLEVNVAPVLTVNSNVTVMPNEEVTFTAMATDADIPANELVFSLGDDALDGMEINPATGEFTWTPADSGQFVVTVIVTDNGVPALSDSVEVTIQVTGNAPPIYNTQDPNFPVDGTEVNELEALEFSVTATDPEGGAVTYTIDADSEAAGMMLDPATGAFTWTPTEEQGPGEFMVTFTATDDGDPAASTDTTITIFVLEVNMAPVLDEIASQTAFPGDPITFTATASDGDIPENGLTFSLSGEQPGMVISADGEFTWVMTEGGPFEVTVIVTDDAASPLSDSQLVTILAPPAAPQAVSLSFCSTEATSLLEWSAIPADGYFVEIDTDPNFSAPELTIQTAQPSVEAPLGGLKVNEVYYWRVAAEVGGVRGAASAPLPFRRWPATIQIGHTLAFPKATESADFRMVSIPGASQGISVASTFPGQTPLEDWRVYTDDAEDVAYPIYLQQVNSDAGTGELFFRPGRGFWALSTSAWEVGTQDLPSVTLDAQSSRFFEIPLFQGNSTTDARWTMIGNPFDFPVRWSDIVSGKPNHRR